MTLELVAFLAPIPFLSSRLESQRSGMAPVFPFELEFCYSGSGKGKNYGKNHGKKIMAKKMSSKNGSMGVKQTFAITALGAVSVQLMGDFTNWQNNPINMEKGAKGVWQTTVELAPGTHHYRFFVDGEWCDDPECTLRVPNPYGGENMIRQVRGFGTAA